MLTPRESETREIKDLSGIWRFRIDPEMKGEKERWAAAPLVEARPMPVPASFNDLVQEAEVRDHIGLVWYETSFFLPSGWSNRSLVLYFGSATHKAKVWLNGIELGFHRGGFLPFHFSIDHAVRRDSLNRLTVCIDNRLTWHDIPPGEIHTYQDADHPVGDRIQVYHFDFYNYAGIHRPVLLVALPPTRLENLRINTTFQGKDGVVDVELETVGNPAQITLRLLDPSGQEVVCTSSGEKKRRLLVPHPQCWEPGNGRLYTLEISLFDTAGSLRDRYRQAVGIRTVEVRGKQFLINGKPVYFRGFGKHEDADLRGRGLDVVTLVKDFNLLKWIGANSFRTSHYPYAEEVLDMADREGIMVIDEVAAVGMHVWNTNERVFGPGRVDDVTLANHLADLRDLIQRDRNHPCVVMWSVANEAATYEDGAVPYFKTLLEAVRKEDTTRPCTIVTCSRPHECKVAPLFDVICFNRYYGWYSDSGRLELIRFQLEKELHEWFQRYGKPVFLTEFGADTIAGFHQDPPVMFSEEFQNRYLEEVHAALDTCDFVIGEHVWNFADFGTKQGITRVGGNKKGIFTRQRQPKSAAFLLRKRWLEQERKEKSR